jgi:peptidoglycan/xylan/chitin deacetylase (PgdA/CDA1 family)
LLDSLLQEMKLLFILLASASSAWGQAEDCNPAFCQPPDCNCGGEAIPGGFSPDQIPQFVLLTFDDSVNDLNKAFYEELFANRFNPNGCPIKATFYVSHEWTDYGQVQDLYADGHEMASHTVTHSSGSSFSEEKWADEVVGQAEMLVKFGGVNPQDVKGMRAPFLAVGGDRMFNTLQRYGLYYDSSMPITTSPSWPYTLEYKMPHHCSVPPCPKESHPGMWEVPMKTLKDVRGGECSMADGCFYKEDPDEIQKIFTQNFLEHYTKSKAPFPLFFHAAWFFNRDHRTVGFLQFIDSILALPDVYFVTSQELIAWTRFPEPLNQVCSAFYKFCLLFYPHPV